MYKIYTGEGLPLHDPDRFESGYQVIDPLLTEELNRQGSLTFMMAPDHPRFGQLPRRTTYVTVKDDRGGVWKGRVIDAKRDTRNCEKIYCEGTLAYLLDSVCRPFSLSQEVSPSAFLTTLLANHNTQTVDNHRHIAVGNVTVTGNIYRASQDAKTTWEIIDDRLLRSIGGYLQIRYTQSGTVLDYLSDFETTSRQKIKYGKNLVSVDQDFDASEIVSHLIPYGARDDNTGQRVDITSENGGSDHLNSDLLVGSYGNVWGTRIWDDVTTADGLLSRAAAWFYKQAERVTINAKAVDLSWIDPSMEPFQVGSYAWLESAKHDLNVRLLCRKKVTPLMDLANASAEFGTVQKTLTDLIGGNK